MQTDFRPVIHSLMETDLYKFTMLQALLHHFPANTAEYRFVCRNQPAYPLAGLVDQVNAQLDHLCSLRFTNDELDYLSTLRYMKPDFIQFLRIFQLYRPYVEARVEGESLSIVARGPQVHVMLFEIYVLAIVNELYFRELTARGHGPADMESGRAFLKSKIDQIRAEVPRIYRFGANKPFEFFDFGLRRRFSGAWHDEVVHTLAESVPEYFRGTSNVYLAKKYGLTPIGTMAHEYLQTFQAVGVQLRLSQKAALETWVQEYRGDLGIALTDVIGMDAFLTDFDLFFAKLFDGLRHDSGDPCEWAEKAIAHYKKLRIDPGSKRLTFSDGLNVSKAIGLYRKLADRVQVGFGIGTNLTNDVGAEPLNIVMKLVRCNDQPVAKLADSPGKTLCDDPVFLAYLCRVFNKPQ